ncbi:hypothetical protein ACFWFI_06380 [Streptomyces sp. NPDC060209]|uniref:hypothetical protein n=1 Tax=Streptomyces sp. NPDC060209 TaxID=3347073 RepID=UPI00366816A1
MNNTHLHVYPAGRATLRRKVITCIAVVVALSVISTLWMNRDIFGASSASELDRVRNATAPPTPADLKVSVDTNPFHASSVEMIEAYGRNQEWMLPQGQVVKGDPGYASIDSFYNFAKSFHGVAVGRLLFGVTIQNLSGGVVYLRSMGLKKFACEDPLKGIRIWTGGGADPVTPRAIVIDLDLPRPVPLYYPKIENLDVSKAKTAPFGFEVPKGDTEQFDIAALIAKSGRSCSFELAIEAVVNGERQTIRISDSGKPFRLTTGSASAYWMYNGGGGPTTWSRPGEVHDSLPRTRGPDEPLLVTDP